MGLHSLVETYWCALENQGRAHNKEKKEMLLNGYYGKKFVRVN